MSVLLFYPPPLVITNNNNTTVSHNGNGYLIEKTSGASPAYNAGAVSSVGAAGDFVLRIKGIPSALSNGIGAGVNSDPLTDDSFGSVDFMWVYTPVLDQWNIMEAGSNQVTGLATSTYSWIWRTGSTLGYGRGAALWIAQASPDRTTISTGTLYFDSTLPDTGSQIEAVFYEVQAQQPVLTADMGLFNYTGQPAMAGHSMASALGTFSYTGQIALTPLGRPMTASLGSFSYTGQAAQTMAAYRMDGAQVSFSYSGQPATLGMLFSMPGAFGTFGYTGQVAQTLGALRMDGGQASYSYAGQPASLGRNYGMPADLGSFTYAGQAAAMGQAYSLTSVAGSFSYAGQAATFGLTASMISTGGSFGYAGQVARAMLNMDEFPEGVGGGAPPAPKVSAFFFR